MPVIDETAYRELICASLPHVIHTEEEHERYSAELEKISDCESLTPEQSEYAQLLTVLIEEFENRTYPIPSATPLEVLQSLMEANNLKQADLLDVFRNKGIASEVLSGKRELSKDHIRKLGERFHVSKDVFL